MSPQSTGAAIGLIRPNGKKISEAAGYLKSSRICLLNWIRETAVASDNVTESADDMLEMLKYCQAIEDMRTKLDVRASVLGR